MAKFHTGNMWKIWDESNLFLITTNAFVKRNKELTMGRGMAKQAATRDSQIPLYFGREMKRQGNHMQVYGLFIPPLWPTRKEGAFQTKLHWQDRADIEIIQASTRELMDWAYEHHFMRADLNFPGIGLGRLHREEVLPIMEILPDNVHIWEIK